MIEIQAIGNVGADATIKESKNGGQQFISFRICVDESYKDKDGVKHERSTWVSCLKPIFNGNSSLAPFIKKGSKVFVRGRVGAKAYTSKEGEIRADITCVVDDFEFCGGPRAESTSDAAPAPSTPTPAAPAAQPAAPAPADNVMPEENGDLPF